MLSLKNKLKNIGRSHFQVVGVSLLILLAVFLLWFNNNRSMQAAPSLVGDVYFEGEYRIGEGEWRPVVKGEHIPSTKGNVTLKG